jgi:hypothetical protein
MSTWPEERALLREMWQAFSQHPIGIAVQVAVLGVAPVLLLGWWTRKKGWPK